MATNADYYVDAYSATATSIWDEAIKELRDEAKASNKSAAAYREDLRKASQAIDRQISSIQGNIESLQTTHFSAHLRDRSAAAKAAASGAKGRRKIGGAFDKMRDSMAQTVSRSVGDAAEREGTQLTEGDLSVEALETIMRETGVAGLMGKFGEEFGGKRPDPKDALGVAERHALALGLQQGLEAGLSSHRRSALSETDRAHINAVVKNVFQVTPSNTAFGSAKTKAGAVTVSGSSKAGGIGDAAVDRLIVESGIADSLIKRNQELAGLEEDRKRLMAEAGRIPSAVTEEDILRQAASRLGPVGGRASEGGNIFAVHRRYKEAGERLEKVEQQRAELDRQAAAVKSMSPAQRILFQTAINAEEMFAHHPKNAPGMTDELLALGGQIANAMEKDPSLMGDYKRVVGMAVELANQRKPDATPEEVRAERDRILEAYVYSQKSGRGAEEFVPEDVEFGRIDPLTEIGVEGGKKTGKKFRKNRVDVVGLSGFDGAPPMDESDIMEKARALLSETSGGGSWLDRALFSQEIMARVKESGKPISPKVQLLLDYLQDEARDSVPRTKEMRESIGAMIEEKGIGVPTYRGVIDDLAEKQRFGQDTTALLAQLRKEAIDSIPVTEEGRARAYRDAEMARPEQVFGADSDRVFTDSPSAIRARAAEREPKEGGRFRKFPEDRFDELMNMSAEEIEAVMRAQAI